MLFLLLVTSTKHYWVISAERRRKAPPTSIGTLPNVMWGLSNVASYTNRSRGSAGNGSQQPIREDHPFSDQGDTEKQEHKRNKPRKKLSRWILLFISGLAVVEVTSWWFVSRNYESTDDAQIEGHLDLVSARISGTVRYINPQVENNQFIEAGTLLLDLRNLDPLNLSAMRLRYQPRIISGCAVAGHLTDRPFLLLP